MSAPRLGSSTVYTRSLFIILLTSLINVTPCNSYAWDQTDVIDAADGKDPFDFTAEVFFKRDLRRARLSRENNCTPSTDPKNCPAGDQIVLLKELRYQRWSYSVTPRVHFGLWKDLELMIETPIMLYDEQEVRFAGNGGDPTKESVTGANSTIAPDQGQDLLEFKGQTVMPGLPTRAGFGDALLMLRFAPISAERDDTRGEWVLEFGYRAPTGDPMRVNQTGVGRGVHELQFGTSFSRKFNIIDPYISFNAVVPVGSRSDSPFQRYIGSQDHELPGARGGFEVGLGFIPYDRPKRGSKFEIDLSLGATYQAIGRDYSELFDALALSAQSHGVNCIENVENKENCLFYSQDAMQFVTGKVAPTTFDGITTVEQYITVQGKLALSLYTSEYFRIGGHLSLAHDTVHFMSTAPIGVDSTKGLVNGVDETGVFVPPKNQAQALEHNPTFVPAIDLLGRRIRVEETTLFSAGLQLAMLF